MRVVTPKATTNNRWIQLFVMLLPMLSGCSYIPWPETFGEVSGANATRSLNGMGVHRRMWESTGAKILTPQKLSPRLDSVDTIVLIGRGFQPPGTLARDWLEKWLGKKSGRTVVYFGRDFDASLMYREDTLSRVASQHDRAQTQLASERATMFVTRKSQIPEDTFCRWFFLRASARPTVHEKFSGPWSSELSGLDGRWPTGVLLEPPNKKLKNKKPSWITGTKTALAPPRTFVVGADGDQALGDKEVQRSIWKSDELEDAKAWDAEWELAGEVKVLLSGNDGSPLVHQISHAKFRGSKIVIVANGAPFLNGSLIHPLQRKIGELVIQECLPAKRVAMIEYNELGLLISNIASGSDTNFGMQMLTVWPLSAITMHAAFLGIIAFVVLLPILGRPQSLAHRSVTDFGLHVEAMGRMMFESRDLLYGLNSIQDYFIKVRRETPPDWLSQMTVQETYNQSALEAAKQNRAKKRKEIPVVETPPVAPSESPTDGNLPNNLPDAVKPALDKAQPTNTTPPDPVS
jgi:hypothetical protein